MNINVMNLKDKNSNCMNNRWNQIKQFLHCDVCINRDWPLYNLWYMYFNINVIVNDYHFRKPGVYDISTEPSGVSRYVINNPGSGCSKYWLTSVQQRGCLWLPSKKNFLSTTKLSMLSNSRSAEVSQNQSSLALSCKHVFWYCTIRPVLYYIHLILSKILKLTPHL